MTTPICSLRRLRRRRRARLVITTAATFTLAVVGKQLLKSETAPSTSSTSSTGRLDRKSRFLSVALPDGKCKVTWPELSEAAIEQTFAASFPGSGARMTRQLVEAITGIVAGSDRTYAKGEQRKITIKTHYPHRAGKELDLYGAESDGIDRGLLLLRNPRDAFQSFHNFKFEKENGLPNHSRRAPVEEWLKWRTDNVFDRQLLYWEEFVIFWMDKLSADKRLIVAYEDLVDPATGPQAALKLRDFLDEVDGVESIERGAVACLWEKLVNYKETGTAEIAANGNVGGKREGPEGYSKAYTRRQLNEFMAVMEKLMRTYASDETLVRILQRYLNDLRNTQPEIEVEVQTEVAADAQNGQAITDNDQATPNIQNMEMDTSGTTVAMT